MENNGYACVAFIRKDDHGTQLLLQKKDRGYRTYPDHWTVFGGHIKEDEGVKECLIREIEEELDLHIFPMEFTFFKEISTEKGEPLKLYTVYFQIPSMLMSEISLGEGCGWAFWYLDEVMDLKLIPHEKKLLEELILTLE